MFLKAATKEKFRIWKKFTDYGAHYELFFVLLLCKLHYAHSLVYSGNNSLLFNASFNRSLVRDTKQGSPQFEDVLTSGTVFLSSDFYCSTMHFEGIYLDSFYVLGPSCKSVLIKPLIFNINVSCWCSNFSEPSILIFQLLTIKVLRRPTNVVTFILFYSSYHIVQSLYLYFMKVWQFVRLYLIPNERLIVLCMGLHYVCFITYFVSRNQICNFSW